MSEIVLRPYQEQFINDIRNKFKHNQRRVVGVAPCGAGKTIMTGWMIREAAKRGNTSIFFVHRKELIEQTSATFTALGIEHGIIASGVKPNYEPLVQIASVQTLVNRLESINQPNFLICDECHHILAKTYLDIINKWDDAFLIGVTATPARMGGKTLNDVFTSMVQAPTVSELIELGNLTHFDYFTMDIELVRRGLDDIAIKKGDYEQKPLSVLMNNPEVIDAIVESYYEYAEDKSAICYCVDVGHSKNVAKAFNKIGVPTAHCDGTTPKGERSQIIEDFRRGKYKILCNAELFGEGFNVPNCHAVILARPTKSLTLHIQQSMRSMRPDPTDPNKVAIIIDCVKNCDRHGYPDTPRYWTLSQQKNKKQATEDNAIFNEAIDNLKICPECGHETKKTATVCPKCKNNFYVDEETLTKTNFEYSSQGKKSQHAPTAIEHYSKIAIRRGYKKAWVMFRALDDATTYADLEDIRRFMGYAKGWSYHKALERNIPLPTKKGVAKSPAF